MLILIFLELVLNFDLVYAIADLRQEFLVFKPFEVRLSQRFSVFTYSWRISLVTVGWQIDVWDTHLDFQYFMRGVFVRLRAIYRKSVIYVIICLTTVSQAVLDVLLVC